MKAKNDCIFSIFLHHKLENIYSSPFSPPHHLAILLRGVACALAEEAVEIGVVFEAQHIGHVLHGDVLGEEDELGLLDFLAVDVLLGRTAYLALEQADVVVLGEADGLGQLVEGDGLAQAAADFGHRPLDALVDVAVAMCGTGKETGEQLEDDAARLDPVAEGALAVAGDIPHQRGAVVVARRVGLGKHHVGIEVAQALEKQLLQGAPLHLGGEMPLLEEARAVGGIFVDVEVVVHEMGVAPVAVCGKGGDEIHVPGAQRMHAIGQNEVGTALHHIEDAGKGAVHILPVPIGMMAGQPDIQGYQM